MVGRDRRGVLRSGWALLLEDLLCELLVVDMTGRLLDLRHEIVHLVLCQLD